MNAKNASRTLELFSLFTKVINNNQIPGNKKKEILNRLKMGKNKNTSNDVFEEMIKGGETRFPFRFALNGTDRGSDGALLVARFGLFFQRMLNKQDLSETITDLDIEHFGKLMLSARGNELKFQSPDSRLEVRVHVDPYNAARLQSFQRVYKHVTSRKNIPSLYGLISDFKKPPGFIVKPNEQSSALLIPNDHIIYDSGRVADKTTTGMLAMNKVFHKDDFARNGIDYYSGNMLPDIGTALTSAYYFAAGFEAPNGKYQTVLTKDETSKLGTRLVDDQFIKQMTQTNKFFRSVEKDKANKIKLARGNKSFALYQQLIKEGWSEGTAAVELWKNEADEK